MGVKRREQRGLPRHSKADISVGYVAAAAVSVALQCLPLTPQYTSSSSCPNPGDTPIPFYRHRKVATGLCNEVTPQVHGRMGNWVYICFLRLFMDSKHLCRLDGGIWMLTFSGRKKSPSLNPHTPSPELHYTHIFLCFLQLCFFLLHSHDEHLPHFVLLLLELTQEFVPLCFVSLLETVKNTETTVRAVFQAQSWVSSLWWSYCTVSSQNIVRGPWLQQRHEHLHRNQS